MARAGQIRFENNLSSMIAGLPRESWSLDRLNRPILVDLLLPRRAEQF